jgi:hypothetical protein
MARVFVHFDGDDLLRELERQGFRPDRDLTPARRAELEARFARKLAGSALWDVLGDLAGAAALEAGLGPAAEPPESGGALNLWPGDVAARDTF